MGAGNCWADKILDRVCNIDPAGKVSSVNPGVVGGKAIGRGAHGNLRRRPMKGDKSTGAGGNRVLHKGRGRVNNKIRARDALVEAVWHEEVRLDQFKVAFRSAREIAKVSRFLFVCGVSHRRANGEASVGQERSDTLRAEISGRGSPHGVSRRSRRRTTGKGGVSPWQLATWRGDQPAGAGDNHNPSRACSFATLERIGIWQRPHLLHKGGSTRRWAVEGAPSGVFSCPFSHDGGRLGDSVIPELDRG